MTVLFLLLSLYGNKGLNMTTELDLERQKAIAYVLADKCTGKRFAIQDLSPAMHSDSEVVLTAEKHRHLSVMYATKQLRSDKQFMMAAIEINGANFRYATPELKNDHELAMQAVKKFGFALADCSDRLKDDIHIVREAINDSPGAYSNASQRIQSMFGTGVIERMENENKVKILDSQILHNKLNMACKPKVEPQARKMKI